MDASTSTPATGRSPALRASDADRERVAAALRRHHLDGRLDTDELQERLGACYAARTEGELAALLADLPREAPASRPRSGGAGAWPPGPAVPLAALALVALALATAAAVSHGRPGPLPLIAVLLLFRLGRGPRRPWTAGSARG